MVERLQIGAEFSVMQMLRSPEGLAVPLTCNTHKFLSEDDYSSLAVDTNMHIWIKLLASFALPSTRSCEFLFLSSTLYVIWMPKRISLNSFATKHHANIVEMNYFVNMVTEVYFLYPGWPGHAVGPEWGQAPLHPGKWWHHQCPLLQPQSLLAVCCHWPQYQDLGKKLKSYYFIICIWYVKAALQRAVMKD